MVDTFYRPEFVEALRLLSDAFDDVESQGHQRPVLVGGAAAELITLGELMSGDLDVVTPWQDIFETALEEAGFERSVGPGSFSRGFLHPVLEVGVEVVGRTLLDGRGSYDRVFLLRLDDGRAVDVICVEDLIADRMAQYNCPPNYDRDRLDQAIKLYKLALELDKDYLDRRIVEETFGDFNLEFLEMQAHA
ncbi:MULTISPECIES: hypothetical protein [Thalassospira]|uniref:Uncharacterized protein n=2 Tax=Thalassospira TaxID=168934 RepID=A0A367WBK2_9PROT|nr:MULTISPECIES: hypothetical protein [Thalassospira]MDG4718050.1 hypothetical protein [Thalassospira sp. FZY0004]RCK37830.1 hypothetical protein TH19_07270 [Thalassospira profundimaris]